jgi:hypothetical protein
LVLRLAHTRQGEILGDARRQSGFEAEREGDGCT